MLPATSRRISRSVTASLAAFIGLAAQLTQQPIKAANAEATEKATQASKLDLTPDHRAMLFDLVRPHDSEWRHLKVEWLTDVAAARKKAAAEDKPIVICYTGGAGYNEPLGVC